MTVGHEKPPTQGKTGTLDQRRFQRFGVKLPCRVKPRGGRKGTAQQALEVETQDVSRGGMFFTASANMEIGTAIEFELELPAIMVGSPAKIHCRGTVTRVVPQSGGRVGIGATIDHYKIAPLGPSPS